MSKVIVLAAALVIGSLVAVVTGPGSVEPSAPVGTVSGAVESPPSVRPVGVMVNSATSLSNKDSEDLAFFGTFAKTRIAFELTYPKGGLIDLRREESRLTLFRDDQGSDLLMEDDFMGPFEMLPRISEDARHLVFVVASTATPHAEATRLSVEGSVSVFVADETVVYDSDPIVLAAGARFEVGPYGFEVSSTGASDWSEGWSVSLDTKQDPSAVVRYLLIDGDEEIELRETMTWSSMGSWQKTLEADAEPGEVVFRVESWKDPQVVEIPLRASAGLGLR